MRSKGKFNPEKTKEVILYLLQNGAMTKEKLGTLLYFIDFNHYERHETSITGMSYLKE